MCWRMTLDWCASTVTVNHEGQATIVGELRPLVHCQPAKSRTSRSCLSACQEESMAIVDWHGISNPRVL